MRVVFDTNIYIATLIAPTSRVARVYWAWRNGRFTLLTSKAQLTELRRVSRYVKFKGIIRPAQAGAMINTLKAKAELVSYSKGRPLSVDPDDDLISTLTIDFYYGKLSVH
ncbi:MAG: hypothetical protein KatS3mg074_213 [Meiothermus sp.]|uniref:Toxin-antitoxin system toxin component, PIN family n=2 Tax=Meiothermus hypogaeus TaxID=884155 RepID=A0ABX9MH94_9DEIN|nr:PIN domain-containing protein [Meiothermus hypogaeus]RIH74362.1 putative toxin-antitoxin system toxin component, PIN family [Meiothermus hypogaeus]GIW37815.1 MAG: hypothetical protein KatS3mg074_213 [Meiothermus sp.]